MNSTSCTLEQIIGLDYYDLFALEDALKYVPPRHGLELYSSEGNITYSLNNARQNIPIDLSGFFLENDDETRIEIKLALGYHSDYTLFLKIPSGCYAVAASLLPALAYDLEEYIKRQYRPKHFVSMEHFLKYLGVNCQLVLRGVSEGLAWPIWQAAEELFADFADGEEICFQNYRDYPPSILKAETRNGPAQLMKINSFRLKRKGEIIMASGIKYNCERGSPKYQLVLFAAQEHLDKLYERYESDFDRCFNQKADLKGGKYTGNLESITLPAHINLSDLVLEEKVATAIQQEIFDFFKLESYYRRVGLPFKRGVVLYGPPGTGKTSLARIITTQCPQTIIWVRPGDLGRHSDIERIFWLARVAQPTIIIMEDVDLYLEDRNIHSGNSDLLADVITQLDGLSDDNDGVLVIMSTNRVEVLETAIVNRPGRIDAKIKLGELPADKIAVLLDKRLGEFPRDFPDFVDLLPPGTTLTGAMATELCTMVLKKAAGNGRDGDLLIRAEYVADALREIEPVNRRVAGFGA